ncbi:MAG: D-alanine--D-alanine ligase [bacterium]|nr:D-alanine--D-alanine ligase [bacterium]
MIKRPKIGVLMGGPSAEHEVSLASGEQVLKHLDNKKYLPVPVKISKAGQWFLNGRVAHYLDVFKKIDVAFLALHGEFGEDGKIQGLLDFHGVKYTGSRAVASALAMDKLRSRKLFNLAGLTTPKTWFIPKDSLADAKIAFPVMVKPRSCGSSVGMMPVDNKKELQKALRLARKFDEDVLVEEYLKGVEVTCGVLEDFNGKKHFALPVTEIIPLRESFFNYKSKYTTGASDEITPARISAKETKKVQKAAIKAHQLLGCAGYSRSDFILVKDRAYLLELNTLPGMTKTSLLPQGAAVAGLTFPNLLDIIIKSSL